MPSIGTQSYWHEAPAPQAPWQDHEQLIQMIAISRALRRCAISPLDSRYFLSGRSEFILQHAKRKRSRREPLLVGQRSLHVEPRLTSRAILSAVFEQLGSQPVSTAEAQAAVRSVLDGPTIEMPLLTCVQRFCFDRGLELSYCSREELKLRSNSFQVADLAHHKTALLLISKTDATLAGAYAEWAPGGGVGRRRGRQGAIRLMSSARDPQPWHKRVQRVQRVDRHALTVLLVSVPGHTPSAPLSLARSRSRASKRSRSESVSTNQSAVSESEAASSADEHNDDDVDDIPLAPLPLSNEPDPLDALPQASEAVCTAVQSQSAGMQRRTRASWSQRLLNVANRRMLYDLSQTQVPIGDHYDML